MLRITNKGVVHAIQREDFLTRAGEVVVNSLHTGKRDCLVSTGMDEQSWNFYQWECRNHCPGKVVHLGKDARREFRVGGVIQLAAVVQWMMGWKPPNGFSNKRAEEHLEAVNQPFCEGSTIGGGKGDDGGNVDLGSGS